jgi:hypothetical protein
MSEQRVNERLLKRLQRAVAASAHTDTQPKAQEASRTFFEAPAAQPIPAQGQRDALELAAAHYAPPIELSTHRAAQWAEEIERRREDGRQKAMNTPRNWDPFGHAANQR